MKILVINQPLNNRGDESAHKALIRTIVKEIPEAEITVLFEYDANSDSVKQYSVLDSRVHYVIHKPIISKGFRKVSQWGLKTGVHIVWHLHPGISSWLKYYKDTDFVLCAPGGINMGGFQSWYHLFNLYCAKIFNKPIAYYGRSIGPFPERTAANRKFKRISLELLHYFSYISIRDKKSEIEINKLGIPYYPVLDSAFLETPHVDIPVEILNQIGENPYVVFVPNILIWHYLYKGKATKEKVASFYISIMNCLFEFYSNYKIVMLPQTFNSELPEFNDVNFMRMISLIGQDKRVVVISDCYSSDIQQAIIAKSQLLVGARYHSIVFAINNGVPFLALSYEHKIMGLLETLKCEDRVIDISNVFDTELEMNNVLVNIRKQICSKFSYTEPRKEAKLLSNNGFSLFKELLYSKQ